MATYVDATKLQLKIEDIHFYEEDPPNHYGGMRVFWTSTRGFGTLDLFRRDRQGRELHPDILGYWPEINPIWTVDTGGEDTPEERGFIRAIMDLIVKGAVIEG